MQKIEVEWKTNFVKSELVIRGKFQPLKAKALLYGDKNESHSVFQKGYKKFYEAEQFYKSDNTIQTFQHFLQKIGIEIKYEDLESFIVQDISHYLKAKKRLYFLIKTLVDNDDQIDCSDPFNDNKGDVYFFLKIAKNKPIRYYLLLWIKLLRWK
jgi:hypothetical protein